MPLQEEFSLRLLAWHRRHGRHDLPWQNTRDPYRIWLSEIMLQQTQVSTVIPYYARFLARFPDIATLAAAAPEEVLALWAGLGYYARARNLHRCAQVLQGEHGGAFPKCAAEIATLPGIGRSTAAAIAAFAFGERAAILDGNVKRVLCRAFGIEGFPGRPAVERELWVLAESLLPDTGIEAYTQGIMDLGATLCTRSRPDCAICPLRDICVAQREGRQDALPAAKPAKAIPERHTDYCIFVARDRVLLERRPPAGIWGGLLCLPEGEPDALAASLGVEVVEREALAPLRHSFTHFRLTLHPLLCKVRAAPACGEGRFLWLPLGDAIDAGLPAPMLKLLAALKPA
ncbi:MAG: A/G-specific adenine glycosylase [Rhodocyclaceae bacterium]|nr:A/G-specific adenine glycosylase [Rhodocyclaceae bacterium]